MTIEQFNSTISNSTPPAGVSVILEALWYDAKGDWNRSHDLVQDLDNSDGSWIHAYLHRKEGDLSNAQYWYSRARKTMPRVPLEKEWKDLVVHFLNK